MYLNWPSVYFVTSLWSRAGDATLFWKKEGHSRSGNFEWSARIMGRESGDHILQSTSMRLTKADVMWIHIVCIIWAKDIAVWRLLEVVPFRAGRAIQWCWLRRHKIHNYMRFMVSLYSVRRLYTDRPIKIFDDANEHQDHEIYCSSVSGYVTSSEFNRSKAGVDKYFPEGSNEKQKMPSRAKSKVQTIFCGVVNLFVDWKLWIRLLTPAANSIGNDEMRFIDRKKIFLRCH